MSAEIKHKLLKRALDKIALSAPRELSVYHTDRGDEEAQIKKYARAQIHLFLHVRFGLIEFEVAESQITDGIGDGGLDAFHLDAESKKIYLIQSKYKKTADGYINDNVDWRELFRMELDRIVRGENTDRSGVQYNGHIISLQTKINEIPDVARWTYSLVYLGNVPSTIGRDELVGISGNVCTEAEILYGNDFYNQVLIPYIKKDFYNKDDFSFEININQEITANRIIYSAELSNGEAAEVQLFFVPTIEIARMMSQYRNSILQYNPRCYVGIRASGVNADIRNSVSTTDHNEFSLLNNGITIVCKQISYNDSTAQIKRASILVSNPQIVNGGQTAFTLAHLYESSPDSNIFDHKEVLTKFIIISGSRDEMIKKISSATNNQTPIKPRDKVANDPKLISIQRDLFDNHGILFERKRGEFFDSVRDGVVDEDMVIDSITLMRLALVLRGQVARARNAGEAVLFNTYSFEGISSSDINSAVTIYKLISNLEESNRDSNIRYRTSEWGNGLKYGQWAIIFAVLHLSRSLPELDQCIEQVKARWIDFEQSASNKESNQIYSSEGFDYDNYYKGSTVDADISQYVKEYFFEL